MVLRLFTKAPSAAVFTVIKPGKQKKEKEGKIKESIGMVRAK